MELSGYMIKKFLMFPEMEPCTLQPKLEKIKQNSPRENFLYLKKLKLRENLYFLKRKLFLYSGKRKRRNGNPKTASYISGGNLQILKIKNFYAFSYKAAKFSKLKYFLIIII